MSRINALMSIAALKVNIRLLLEERQYNFMKIQFLNGGLANQVFQYIFARYYELSHPQDVMYMDDSYFALNTVHNGYELEKVFGLKPHMLSECFDEDVWGYILEERKTGKSVPQILFDNGIGIYMIYEADNYVSWNPFDGIKSQIGCNEYHPEILDAPGDIYYHGYWINKEWFHKYKDVFLKELRFPELTDAQNLEYKDRIRGTRSVSIHIRRGDYVKLGIAQDEKFYHACCKFYAENIPGNWELFVFSDDLPWCREHQEGLGFGYFDEVNFVEGNVGENSYRDLQLMSMCKGMIFSTSAFCYLGGLLNTNMEYYVNPTTRKL